MDSSFNYIISPEISEFRRFSPKLKIGVLASGKGTNFQELINLSEKGELDIDIKVLITNKDEAGCIKRAETKKIPLKFIAYTFGDTVHNNIKTQSDFLSILNKWGFKVSEYNKTIQGINNFKIAKDIDNNYYQNYMLSLIHI